MQTFSIRPRIANGESQATHAAPERRAIGAGRCDSGRLPARRNTIANVSKQTQKRPHAVVIAVKMVLPTGNSGAPYISARPAAVLKQLGDMMRIAGNPRPPLRQERVTFAHQNGLWDQIVGGRISTLTGILRSSRLKFGGIAVRSVSERCPMESTS